MSSIDDFTDESQIPAAGVVRLKAQFSTVPASIYANPNLGMIEIAVYGFLDQWRTSSYPRIETITNALCRREKLAGDGSVLVSKKNVSRHAVRDAIKNLELFGYVMKIRRGVKRTNVYVLDETGSMSEAERGTVVKHLQQTYPELNVPNMTLSDGHNCDGHNCDGHEYDRDSENNTYSEDIKTNLSDSSNSDRLEEPEGDKPEPEFTADMIAAKAAFIDYMQTVTGERVTVSASGMKAIKQLFTTGPKGVAEKSPVTLNQFRGALAFLASDDCLHVVESPVSLRVKWLALKQAKRKVDARNGSKPSEGSLEGNHAADDVADAWRSVSVRPGGKQIEDPNANRPKPEYVQPIEPFEPTKTRDEIRAMLGREPVSAK